VVQASYPQAQEVLDRLEALGIGYDDVTATLEREGVEKFDASWVELLHGVQTQLGAGRR
jgi:transaldolase